MARRRNAAAGIAALSSPVRLEIYEAFQVVDGVVSVAELAERLDRRPTSLYYHLGVLERAGLVERAGERPAGRTREALYRRATPSVRLRRLPPGGAPDVARSLRAVLRVAERDYLAALEALEPTRSVGGKDSGLRGARNKAWLTRDDLRELHRRIDDLQAFLRARSEPGRGRCHALTLCLAPVRRR